MSAVAKVNDPSAAMGRLSPPLFCKIRFEPERPVTVPPTVKSDAVTEEEVSVLLTPPVHAASDRTPSHSHAARTTDPLGRAPVTATVHPMHMRVYPSPLEPLKLLDPATDCPRIIVNARFHPGNRSNGYGPSLKISGHTAPQQHLW